MATFFLSVYYLSETVANTIGMLYHGAIMCPWGEEWTYGTSGVSNNSPAMCPPHKHKCFELLGNASVSRERLLHQIQVMIANGWTGENYLLASNNCLSFCRALASWMQLPAFPWWVDAVAKTGSWVLPPSLQDAMIGSGSNNESDSEGEDSEDMSDHARNPLKRQATDMTNDMTPMAKRQRSDVGGAHRRFGLFATHEGQQIMAKLRQLQAQGATVVKGRPAVNQNAITTTTIRSLHPMTQKQARIFVDALRR